MDYSWKIISIKEFPSVSYRISKVKQLKNTVMWVPLVNFERYLGVLFTNFEGRVVNPGVLLLNLGSF